MVHWGWMIGAFFLGKLMGIVVMAILYGSWSHKEEKAQKKRSADGGTSTNRSDSRKDFYL